ncbi:MAG: rhomboid family intramembrane serine protease [Candidatus Diapherotrites archaeon]|nr:rhomboid family intramembrane serine protease [Candidatus Diapherotrites archaeon]
MAAKILHLAWKFKVTIFLFLLVVGTFFLLAENYYISNETINLTALSLFAPWNIFVYELIHIGPYHLLSNVVALVAFGLVLEHTLSSRDLLAIFFSATVATGAFFLLLNPMAMVIGASAGILAMITSAFFSDPKRTIIAAIVAILFGLFLTFTLNAAIVAVQDFFESQTQVLQEEIQEAVEEGNEEKQQELTQQLVVTVQEQVVFEENREQEFYAVSDYFSHLFAAFFGVAYMFFFRRKKFIQGIEELDDFLHEIAGKLMKKTV